jgi:hypothetical protein
MAETEHARIQSWQWPNHMQNIMKTSFFHDIMQYKPLITSQPKLFYFRQITVPNFTKCLQFSHKAFV